MIKPKNNNIQKVEVKVLPLNECLAKTINTEAGKKAGVSVETHCLIVGYIAREILKRFPLQLRESLFPSGTELIAAAHDLGKISPGFQEKIYFSLGGRLGLVDPELDKRIGYHYAVSQATIVKILKYIPEILGRHHGYSPQSIASPDAEIYGGAAWQQKRLDLLDHLKSELKVDWPQVKSALNSDVLTGLTTVADWIGSGSLFDEVDHESWKANISEALDRAGFVVSQINKGLSFQEVFGFSPHSIQTQLVESINCPGAYVLEAPMGIGKTEAALFAAYKVLEQGQATGIYFALPTQLTSDKIYERMNQFLEKILDKDDTNRISLLLHSSAWLRDTELGVDGEPGHSWFDSAKRGLLAPFAVGTIDQALMAVMNVKHGFVRTFGLAGKVVILDEVHSYDSYTGTILKELVSALRELHCTVIILSATLTDKHRRSILNIPLVKEDSSKGLTDYPLISAYPVNGQLQELISEKCDDHDVKIQMIKHDDLAIEEALTRAERGEQVLWIENTVQEAQDRFNIIAGSAAQMGVECGLLHSRFIRNDRAKNEAIWVSLYGKEGQTTRKNTGRILIGTQVLEQSLDIDADFLVTQLCPTDMIFQRLGRLWRHRSNDEIRPAEAVREAWIIAPALNKVIETQNAFGKSAKVYSPYILCRTLEVWQDIFSVKLPADIRCVLEATYIDRGEDGPLARYKQVLEKDREKLSGMALVGVSRGGKTLAETKASTRYSEMASVEVLLVRNVRNVDNGIVLRLLDGVELLIPKFSDTVTRRKIAVKLIKNTLSVPEYLAPITPTKNMSWLKDYVYIGDDTESPFRVAIVRDSDELSGLDQSEASSQYTLEYDDRLGYQSSKKGRGEMDEE